MSFTNQGNFSPKPFTRVLLKFLNTIGFPPPIVHVHIYIYIYVCIHLYICIYIYIYTYIHILAHIKAIKDLLRRSGIEKLEERRLKDLLCRSCRRHVSTFHLYTYVYTCTHVQHVFSSESSSIVFTCITMSLRVIKSAFVVASIWFICIVRTYRCRMLLLTN